MVSIRDKCVALQERTPGEYVRGIDEIANVYYDEVTAACQRARGKDPVLAQVMTQIEWYLGRRWLEYPGWPRATDSNGRASRAAAGTSENVKERP